MFLRIKSSQYNNGIRQYIMRKSSPPFYHFVLEVLLGSDKEKGFYRRYLKQTLEVIISPVEDVI